jgi:hypothetical protein
MTDHDVAVRAARAAFAYWCNINGIGPDDQEPEWRNNVVRRVELVGMMHAALEAAAPAIRAEGRREGLEEAAKEADAHATAWGLAMASPAIVIAAAIRAMAEKGPTDEPR